MPKTNIVVNIVDVNLKIQREVKEGFIYINNSNWETRGLKYRHYVWKLKSELMIWLLSGLINI